MTENGLFVLGGPETQLHDILWAVHDGKNRGKRGGGKFRGVPGYGGRSGAERCAFLSYTYAHVCKALALTEPEQGVGLKLNPSDCTVGYALLNPSDRSMVVN